MARNMPPADWNHQTKWGLLEWHSKEEEEVEKGGGDTSPGAPVGEVFPWESRPLCFGGAPTTDYTIDLS